MSKKDTQFLDSKKLNDQTYTMYYNRLTNLAINSFRWNNVPETIDVRFLEMALFSDGMTVFFKDEDIGFLCLQVMIAGPLDVYRIPIIRTAYATNGYRQELTPKNSVVIFNNYLHTNGQLDIEMYSRRLYEIERAIDVNVRGQKTPKILLCTENQRLVIQNLFKQYDGNEPFIFGEKNLDLTGLKTVDISSPFVSDKLQILKKQIYNEALSYLGIENSNTDKKERLVSDEVTTNLGGVEAQRETRLSARQDACEKINKMFGLNMSVEFRAEKSLNEAAENEKEEGEEV